MSLQLFFLIKRFWLWFLLGVALVLVGQNTGHGKEATYFVAVLFFVVVVKTLHSRTVAGEALLAYRAGQYEKAIEIAQRAIAEQPSNPGPYLTASAAYLSLNQPNNAIEFCDRLLRIKPKLAMAFGHRAAAQLVKLDSDKAIEDATAALSLDPHQTRTYITRASANLYKGNYSDAIKDCDVVIAKTEFDEAFYVRSFVRYRMNELNAAMADIDRAIGLCRKSTLMPRLVAMRAAILGRGESSEKAIEECDKALSLDAKCHSALVIRAHHYCRCNDLTRAKKDLDSLQALRLETYYQAQVLNERARLALLEGDMPAALEDAEIAVQKHPTSAMCLSTRGLILARQGKQNEAIADLSRAIEVDPFCSEAYWFRGELYEAIGERKRANDNKAVATKYGYKPYL